MEASRRWGLDRRVAITGLAATLALAGRARAQVAQPPPVGAALPLVGLWPSAAARQRAPAGAQGVSKLPRRGATFPLVDQVAELSRAVTPEEYRLMRPALVAALGNDDWRGNGATVFAHGHAQRVSLGTLGTGYVFQGLGGCGATGNCTVALVYAKAGGGWAAYVAGGDGMVLAGSGPVPDAYISWNMSAATGNLVRVHFNGTAYVQDGAEEYDNDAPVAEPGAATFPLPGSGTVVLGEPSLSPAEYGALRAPVLAALRRRLTAAAAAAAFDHARGLEDGIMNSEILAILKAGDCDALGNCSIFTFQGSTAASGFVSMVSMAPAMRGWSAAAGHYNAGPLALDLPENSVQLTLARRLSGSTVMLRHYRRAGADRFGGARWAVDACADATGSSGAGEAFNPAQLSLKPAACSMPAPPAREIPVDAMAVGSVLKDSTGALWATDRTDMPCENELYRWSADHWEQQAPPLPNVYLGGIRAALGGDVVASWTNCAGMDPPAFDTVLLHGDQSTGEPAAAEPPEAAIQTSIGILVPIGGDMRLAHATAWAPGHEPGFARWSPDRPPVRVFTYDDSQLRVWPNSMQFPGPGTMGSLADASGRTWIWGNGFAHGVLLVHDGAVEALPHLVGLPDSPIRFLAAWDVAHIAAVMDDGLYQIDTRSLQAAPVPPPAPGAFDAVEAVFTAGGERYVESGHARGPTNGVAGPLTLWRLRDGNWQAAIADTGHMNCCLLNSTAWAYTHSSLWISALPSGLWHVPNDGPAELVDWTHGLPLGDSVSRLIALDANHLFAVDGRGRSAEFDTNAVAAVKPAVPDFSLTNAWGSMARDAQGGIWALQPGGVARWNGHAWTAHPFPTGILRARLSGVNVDSDGRIWLLPNCSMGPVAIYSPARDAWSTSYADYRNELTQQAQGRRFLETAKVLDPAQSSGGRMAFFGPCGALNYFNGQRWQLWQPNALRQATRGSRATQPGFDTAGNLIVNVDSYPENDRTWKWDGAAWAETTAHALSPLPAGYLAPALAPPPGCATAWPETLEFDAQGRGWWTAAGNLYVGVAGR
ncbi:MAG: hypothetical protein ACRD1L_09015, partial [Terriglobales bacterium]